MSHHHPVVAHCNTLQHTRTCCNLCVDPTCHSSSLIRVQVLHIATHCNTLQHTAIYYNTHEQRVHCRTCDLAHAIHPEWCSVLEHTATRCNTLQCTVTHCNTLPHTAAHCNTLQHAATRCNTLQHNTTLCNTLQHTSTHVSVIQFLNGRTRDHVDAVKPIKKRQQFIHINLHKALKLLKRIESGDNLQMYTYDRKCE